jgi:membrane-associated phospholipid phosphatase
MKYAILCIFCFCLFFTEQMKAQELSLKKEKKWITPLVLTGVGMALYNDASKNAQIKFRDKHLSNFETSLDDYLQFTPTLLLIGANIAQKISGKDQEPIKDKIGKLIIGTGTYFIAAQILKRGINETRPDGSDYSFPSGHTTVAFFGARMLDKEFRKTHPWLVVGAYSIATATGVLRVANNKHWASDVFVGAGLGIASAEFAYWLYPKLKSKFEQKQAFEFEPILAPNLYAAKFTYSF